MHVNDLRPRGYCHGVKNALAMIKKIINDPHYPRPITVLGSIVHNHAVVNALKIKGVDSLMDQGQDRMALLDQVSSGTLVLTAHGTSKAVVEKAQAKGLTVMNAICHDVKRVHDTVREHLDQGHGVVYIGHQNHPEPEAVLAIDPAIHFVESLSDVHKLPKHLSTRPLFVTNQTTLSVFDLLFIFDALRARFDHVIFDDRICGATRQRQEAVIHQPEADLLIVVGDPKSSNANRLQGVSIVGRQIKAYLVTGAEALKKQWFDDVNVVNVTSGASTPTAITEHVIKVLKAYDKKDPSTWRPLPVPGPDEILGL
ncbi:MAG: 4-hydroxy-3-methylbut-2-enyl diphosphate reductase [Acholeplasmataceae bacterium]|nr:4-hydroxy-3-methylbut-2-enyl diphosphate reductase [Acholeplasmataceae bacterium]